MVPGRLQTGPGPSRSQTVPVSGIETRKTQSYRKTGIHLTPPNVLHSPKGVYVLLFTPQVTLSVHPAIASSILGQKMRQMTAVIRAASE